MTGKMVAKLALLVALLAIVVVWIGLFFMVTSMEDQTLFGLSGGHMKLVGFLGMPVAILLFSLVSRTRFLGMIVRKAFEFNPPPRSRFATRPKPPGA